MRCVAAGRSVGRSTNAITRPAATYQKIIDAYPDAMLLGLTATPCRGDGRGLGGIFETMIECPQVAELIEQGYLVKTRSLCAGRSRSQRRAHVEHGDYVEAQLAERMDRPKLVGDIVTHWHKYGERRKTVALCRQRRALHPPPRRVHQVRRARRAYRRHRRPSPSAMQRCAARIRRDRARDQLHGADRRLGHARGRLLHPGAADQEDGPLSADDRPRAAPRRRQARRHRARSFAAPCFGTASSRITSNGRSIPISRADSADASSSAATDHGSRLLECTQCGAVRVAGEPCFALRIPAAAPAARRRASPTAISASSMATTARQGRLARPGDRARWHAMLASDRAASAATSRAGPPYKYKEKFGAWPPYGATPTPIAPTPEVRSWVRSRLIAYAKRRGAA